MKILVKLEIEYDISAMTHAGIDEETARDELENVLSQAVHHLAGEGLLSGETLATVDTWDATLHDGHGYMSNRMASDS